MHGKHIIVPSVLEGTIAKAQGRINELKTLRAPLQLDLMDGLFVRTRSMSRAALRRLRVPSRTTAHLMVRRPMDWIFACRAIGIRRFAVHVEAEISVDDVRAIARKNTVIMVLNPGSPIRMLQPFLPLIDGVQVMTINPGRQGSPFMRSQLSVIRELRKRHRSLWIAADGGMDLRTIPLARNAGVNEFIVGSALTRAIELTDEYHRLVTIIVRPTRSR